MGQAKPKHFFTFAGPAPLIKYGDWRTYVVLPTAGWEGYGKKSYGQTRATKLQNLRLSMRRRRSWKPIGPLIHGNDWLACVVLPTDAGYRKPPKRQRTSEQRLASLQSYWRWHLYKHREWRQQSGHMEKRRQRRHTEAQRVREREKTVVLNALKDLGLI
jgi:hypothetical protein